MAAFDSSQDRLSRGLSNTSDLSTNSGPASPNDPQFLKKKSAQFSSTATGSIGTTPRGNSKSKSSRSMKRQSSSQEEEIDLTELQRGSLFLKFGRKGPVHERLVRLSKNCRYITWEGSWMKMKSTEERSGKIYVVLIIHFSLPN